MNKRAAVTRIQRVGLILVAAAVTLSLGLASTASANNLDRRTATDAVRLSAKRECQATRGCQRYFARRVHPVSRHKAFGKSVVVGARQGVGFVCVRQVVVTLDHFDGDVRYFNSRRRCRLI
jgi:hypothetical protein